MKIQFNQKPFTKPLKEALGTGEERGSGKGGREEKKEHLSLIWRSKPRLFLTHPNPYLTLRNTTYFCIYTYTQLF